MVDKESLGFLINDVQRLLRRAIYEELQAQSSLTPAQARVLVYLSRHERLRQVELADLLDIRPMTLARQIDQLEQQGLVERRPDPADRRAHHLFLTTAATAHLATIRKIASRTRATALRGLGSEQVDTLVLALKGMRENLTARK